ncbi:MAG: hypothetical protein WC834_01825 [Eubacteriales bacterium]
MGRLIDLLLFFSIYSFMGWMLETIITSINERKLINRGFLNGSFCPIYGFCAVLIILSTSWVNIVFKNHFTALVISILFSVILITVMEYITGYILENVFTCKWWDYSDNAINLHGYICLQYSLLWGLLAFLLVQVAHPVISRNVFSIPMSTKFHTATFLLLYFLIDTAKSVLDALDLRKVILNWSSFSINKYYEKMKELIESNL